MSQVHPNRREVVIAYGGRGLRTSEKITVTELECLAVLEGIRAYNPYLANKEFMVITDHYALQWLHKTKKETGQLSRWAIQLQGYSYKVEHSKGKQTTNADALSRRDYPPESQDTPTDNEVPSGVFAVSRDNYKTDEWTEIRIQDEYAHLNKQVNQVAAETSEQILDYIAE